METKKITPEQLSLIKKSIDKMAKSDEQFIFIIFKNKNGTDHITQYSFNMVQDKIAYYFKEAVKTAEFRNDEDEVGEV